MGLRGPQGRTGTHVGSFFERIIVFISTMVPSLGSHAYVEEGTDLCLGFKVAETQIPHVDMWFSHATSF